MHIYLPPTSPVHAASVDSTSIKALTVMSNCQVRPLTVHKLIKVQPVSIGVAGGNVLAISSIYSTVVKTKRLCCAHTHTHMVERINLPKLPTPWWQKANFRAQSIKMQSSGTKYAQAKKITPLLLILFRVLLLSNTCLMCPLIPAPTSTPTLF